MRRTVTVLVVLLAALSVAAPARAGGLQNLLIGLNGLLTFPADPVMMVVTPPEQLEDMPAFPVLGRIAGLVVGTLQGGYRAFSGATDVVTAAFIVVPSFSPQPRYQLIPGIEFEE
jgi:ABC-type uncharacterized transport system permease subunit